MGYAIGIDIGTANTRVAVYRDGKLEVIPDKDGLRSMPSYLAFTGRCRLFGSAAKAQATSNLMNTVYGVKRVLGKRLKPWQVNRYKRISPNDVSLETSKHMTISVNYKKRLHRVLPVQVLGMLFARARANAETYLGEMVQQAVITVPVHFDKFQRQEIYDAALLAGIKALRIDTSIESIALYYAFTTSRTRQKYDVVKPMNVYFLDFGAGFFNAGLVEISGGTAKVRSVTSNKDLGGEDLIDRVYDYLAAVIQRKWNWDINMDIRARHRLRRASEYAVTDLSSAPSTQVYIDSLHEGQVFERRLTRQTLEHICQDLFHSTLRTIDNSLHEANVNKSSVKEIVITGGCSRIPKVQEVWSNHFNSKPLIKWGNPNESEVLGAAVHAAMLSQSGNMLDNLILLTLEPFDIGVGTAGGDMSTMIPRNRNNPTRETTNYRLYDFNFASRERPILQFYQGDDEKVKYNMIIGTLDLSGLPPKWNDGNAETKIEITISSEAERGVTAYAVIEGQSTGPTAWQTVTLRNKKELESLIAQAEAYKEDDAMEEALVAERYTLDLRLASLNGYQPPPSPTKNMIDILESLALWWDKLDELEPADLADYRGYASALDRVERNLETEEVRGMEIAGLRSRAEELRAKVLTTTQTPGTEALLRDIDSVTQWVDENPDAEIQEYQAKLLPLVAISLELTTLREAPPSRESTPSTGAWTPQTPENGTPARMISPRGIEGLFPESGAYFKSKYTDADFEVIASYLRNTGHQNWSKVPRIYTVLRLVDQVHLVDTFLLNDMTDIWFPFSDNTLPKALKQPHRSQFLNTQEAVFSKALELERGFRLDDDDDKKLYRKHAHFSQSEPLPFEVKGNLGSGAHGIVDKVVSTLSYKEYARKRFTRSASNSNRRDIKSFLNEVRILKMLRNKHCIDLIGSYSDQRHFALIMHPVAEFNLERYCSLALDDEDKRSILQGFFGCLAGTLDYLHSQKVVHQDIKPQNILVKNNSHVLVTDFGIARSWEDLTRATITADLDRTWVYAAPEVARGGPKNETADVWSLGCVFLEMLTVLKGQSPTDMRTFLKTQSDSTSFHENATPGHLAAWVELLRNRSPPELNSALEWVESMLQVDPYHRCRPHELFDNIAAASESTSVLFCGACCRDRGESALGCNDDQMDRWSEGDDEDIQCRLE